MPYIPGMPTPVEFPEPDWATLPDTLTKTEAAELLNVKGKTLEEYVRRGDIQRAGRGIYTKGSIAAYWRRRQRNLGQGPGEKETATPAALPVAVGIQSPTLPPQAIAGSEAHVAILELTAQIRELNAHLRALSSTATTQPPRGLWASFVERLRGK